MTHQSRFGLKDRKSTMNTSTYSSETCSPTVQDYRNTSLLLYHSLELKVILCIQFKSHITISLPLEADNGKQMVNMYITTELFCGESSTSFLPQEVHLRPVHIYFTTCHIWYCYIIRLIFHKFPIGHE